jgi:hypothetical protein
MIDHNDPAPGMLAPKRVAPPKVKPVTIGRVRFEALHWGRDRGLGQNGGYLAAFDARTGAELWLLQVYKIDYREDLEEDVQDIFIESLKAGSRGTLKIIDERERRYVVDPATRTVRAA